MFKKYFSTTKQIDISKYGFTTSSTSLKIKKSKTIEFIQKLISNSNKNSSITKTGILIKKCVKYFSTHSYNKHIEKGKERYMDILKSSLDEETREAFWDQQAQEIFWYKNYNKVLDDSNKPNYRWFEGGETNIVSNCIDRHLETDLKNSLAFIWESAYLHKFRTFTYGEVDIEIKKICKILIGSNISKGDRVVIYMPMIPEAVFSMLACAKLGIIHSVVFGGFAADELANRINDCEPKMIITASAGIEPKKIIPYYPIVKHALDLVKKNPELIKILSFERNEVYEDHDKIFDKNHIIYSEGLLNKAPYSDIKNEEIQTVPLNSTDPLYILYTSGTTGTPKGIVRDVGGTCVALNYSMKTIFNINIRDVIFTTSDIGWVVGHSYIVYAPLLRGATSIIYEGKPVNTPNGRRYWDMIQKYQVKSLFTSPSALRAIKKEDPEANYAKEYYLNCLESIHVAGERFDPDTMFWTEKSVGTQILLNDNWWQTETGWPICSNNLGISRFPTIPGCAGMPLPGYDIKIMEMKDINETNSDQEYYKELHEPLQQGKIYIKLPMPPSFMLTLWRNDEAFEEKYLTPDHKFYITGDSGYYDEDGFLHILNRTDDVINVAGHRLSTGRIEEVLMNIPEIAEAAVVGYNDEIKGEIPLGFIVLNGHIDYKHKDKIEKLKTKALEEVVLHIGPIAKMKDVFVIEKLPKTRSGKIVRALMRKILNKQYYEIPQTLEDKHVLDLLIEEVKKHGYHIN